MRVTSVRLPASRLLALKALWWQLPPNYYEIAGVHTMTARFACLRDGMTEGILEHANNYKDHNLRLEYTAIKLQCQ